MLVGFDPPEGRAASHRMERSGWERAAMSRGIASRDPIRPRAVIETDSVLVESALSKRRSRRGTATSAWGPSSPRRRGALGAAGIAPVQQSAEELDLAGKRRVNRAQDVVCRGAHKIVTTLQGRE